MRVWVTRARPGADTTAARLERRGHEPLVAPLLEVRGVAAEVDLKGVGALAFTSANAVSAFLRADEARAVPVFAVGEATAQAARAAGYEQVESAAGGVTALARLIARRAESLKGPVLHPSAREPAGDLAALLASAGVRASTVTVYETVPLAPSDEAAAMWASLDAVLLHSRRAATVFTAVTAAWPHADPRVLCLSEAVAEPLGTVYPRSAIAAYPDEDALLNLLDVTGP